MKNLIEKLNLTIKEFAELYEIPYNTVRQWYNGTRQAPQYIKKMIETIIELKSNGKQMPIKTGTCYYVIEKEFECSQQKDLEIYEKDSILYKADKDFWENEAAKPHKYAPKVRCFEVMEK